MGEQAEDLNYDFNYNMFLTKTFLGNLASRDRTYFIPLTTPRINQINRFSEREKAVRWMRKLSTCNKSIDEMKLRNDFIYYLVLNAQEGELKAPFNEMPPAGPLLELAKMLVSCRYLIVNASDCLF